MTILQDVSWGDCLLEPRRDLAIDRQMRESYGIRIPVLDLYTPCPWLARALATANRRHGRLAHLDPDLADLVFLAVSQDNSCRYCYASQRAMLRVQGFDEMRIRKLEEASFTAHLDPRERRALDYARRISRANPPPGAADRAQLRAAGFSDAEIQEITFVAATTVMGNRVTTIPAVPVTDVEGADFSGWRRLFLPLVARRVRARERPGKPEFLTPELLDGPYAYVEAAFDGLPLAFDGRHTVLEAWDSPILTRRAKALVFAVIARGLGSARAEREAAAMLAEEGLDAEKVDAILAHLGSEALDPIEAILVPFARETIRCRPDDIQRRARTLRERLTLEQFLECVGIVGLANCTVRLSLAACEA